MLPGSNKSFLEIQSIVAYNLCRQDFIKGLEPQDISPNHNMANNISHLLLILKVLMNFVEIQPIVAYNSCRQDFIKGLELQDNEIIQPSHLLLILKVPMKFC